MKKTLLLVFIHGFKGTDATFSNFPKDLRALLSHTLPKIRILSVVYPQFETRGDLKQCVGRFKEWLQNKVIDLEIATREGNDGPASASTADPSVHVVLCGHSMGGIVAAETLLSIARDEVVPAAFTQSNASNSTSATSTSREQRRERRERRREKRRERKGYATASSSSTTSEPPPSQHDDDEDSGDDEEPARAPVMLFPYIEAILAFDTPYLGISPGVLAHGAEMQISNASSAYKAFDTASQLFGWNTTAKSASSAAAADAAATAAASAATPKKWNTFAMVGGAAAAIAGIAGAAYLSWNQINQGLAWAGSHLEFVGCLARGAELKQRVEAIVAVTRAQHIGFANFYGALGEATTSKTKYAGAVLGDERTFCVVPRDAAAARHAGLKREASSGGADTPPHKHGSGAAATEQERMEEEGRKVQDFARDPTKSKGRWVRCVNAIAPDEISAHTGMFAAETNPAYHDMLVRARDQVAEWVQGNSTAWYEGSSG